MPAVDKATSALFSRHRPLLTALYLLALCGCGNPATPAIATCGDGVRSPAEACDDGNLVDHDGCSATCQLEPNDCAGTFGGTARLDACGQCAGGATGPVPCEDSCRQQHGAGAFVDHCGQCVEGDSGKKACEKDCSGLWSGSAALDQCGRCAGGNTGVEPCALDCAGQYGGGATVDNCGQCVGGNTGRTACARDCSGTWGGSAHLDHCALCVDGTTGRSACEQDCTGSWGGTAHRDQCNACVGGTTGASPCQQDCNGDWGGQAAVDHCGACVGGLTGRSACERDCNGAWGGAASVDHCGACVGGDTGRTACQQDCNSQWGGSAHVDGCGQCVGGTTGRTACQNDCNGELGGTAHWDECRRCVGGSTGQTACQQDCAGRWGGTAGTDSCGRCVGGDTGRDACQDAICVLGKGETIATLVANPACEVVQLPAGNYPLSMMFSDATMGQKTQVELRGAGKDATSLSWVAGIGSVVNVVQGRALVLRELKVTGGRLAAAVWNEGRLSLDGVEVSGNSSSSGGGGVHNAGVATIARSTIADNQMVSSGQAGGAGILNLGDLDVRDSAIRNNRLDGAGNYGAGLFNSGGKVRLANVDIEGNAIAYNRVHLGGADRGGGLYTENGEVVGEQVRIVRNVIDTTNSRAEGGGIAVVESRVELSADSTVDENRTTTSDFASGGGLFAEHPTALVIAGVAFRGNSITAEQGAAGGAIAVLRGSLALEGNALDDNVVVTRQLQGSGAAAVLIREGQLSMKSGTMNRNRVDGGDVRGGLVRVEDMTSPSEADEALLLDGIEASDNHIATIQSIEGGLFYANDVLVIGHSKLSKNVIDGANTGIGGVSGGLALTRRQNPGRTSFDGLEVTDNRVAVGNGNSTGGLFVVDVLRGNEQAQNSFAVRGSRFIGNSIQTGPSAWLRGGLFFVESVNDVIFDGCDIRENQIATEGDQPSQGQGRGSVIAGGLFENAISAAADGQTHALRSFQLSASNLGGNRVGNATGTTRVDGGLFLLDLFSSSRADFSFGAVNSTIFDNAVAAVGTSSTLLFVQNQDAEDAKLELANVTVANNRVAGRFGAVLEGGFSQRQPQLTVGIANSIVLGNEPGLDKGCLISGPQTSYTSDGYNLLDATGACPSLQRQASEVTGTLADLGAYGDHGGSTYSVAIDRAPALDGGNLAGCLFRGVVVQSDQRGLPRPQGGRCDIGAFELQP